MCHSGLKHQEILESEPTTESGTNSVIRIGSYEINGISFDGIGITYLNKFV